MATTISWSRQLTVRFSSVVPLACLLTAIVAAQDPEVNPKRLLIATREVPPFAMKDADGQRVGISIELLREIKADLESTAEHETELEFREMGLEEMLDAVGHDDVDLAAAAITVNYDREKRIDLTHPFHSTGLGIAVSGTQVQSWDRVSERHGLTRVLGDKKLSEVAGLLVYIVVLVPVIVGSLNALQIAAVTQPASNMLNKILATLPGIFAAVLVVSIAYVVGRVVSGMATNMLNAIGFDQLPARLGLAAEPTEGRRTPSELAANGTR